MKTVAALSFIILLSVSTPARADIFGGDVVVLTQILVQTIQELYQLKEIFQDGRDSLDLMRDINRGINDSMALIRTAYPNANPGLFKEWDKTNLALQGVQNLYGTVSPSPESSIQQDTDQNVAEAIALNNQVYKYSDDIDDIGEEIKNYSHQVSPGGAQKLTAEGIGILLNVMNQSMRTQATGLKLQAQTLALENYKEKESTKHTIDNANILSQSMTNQDVSFQLPRF